MPLPLWAVLGVAASQLPSFAGWQRFLMGRVRGTRRDKRLRKEQIQGCGVTGTSRGWVGGGGGDWGVPGGGGLLCLMMRDSTRI